jgi:hypothetical protein
MRGMRWGITAAALASFTILFGCSSSDRRTERLAVTYLDGQREGSLTTTAEVPVAGEVKKAAAEWVVAVDDSGCEGDGRTLVLADRAGDKRTQLGEPCVWDDSVGVVSPDGRYVAAFLLGDGASAEIHLVDLGTSPVDEGVVPGSRSSNRSATWTSDGRLWFTSDVDGLLASKIFGYDPVRKQSVSVTVPQAAVVTNIAARFGP